MIVIPLLAGTFAGLENQKPATIDGFLTFYIAGYCPTSGKTCPINPATGQPYGAGEIWGYFVQRSAAGGSDYHGYTSGFGKIVVLIG
jgi:hypothetical protein